ncbi:hypothetical protein ASF80_13325 [Microbacterium sp. Leaf159]|nr:hypothetical protein ASF80_13325 [Microbacterium sp. Leaf159]
MLDDVMDLAPGCRDVASGDEAFLVAGDDRPALMHGEDAVGGRDADDPALIEQDSLDGAGAADVRGDGNGEVGTGSGDRRPPAITARCASEVFRVDVHDQDG